MESPRTRSGTHQRYADFQKEYYFVVTLSFMRSNNYQATGMALLLANTVLVYKVMELAKNGMQNSPPTNGLRIAM